MIEVRVWSLALDEKNQFPVVILRSLDGEKRLPIWIGPPEANAIAMEIAKKRFKRPLTHDLVVAILTGFDIQVPRVEITELRDNTFFAKIYLDLKGEIVALDARPSDAIAVALKSKARLFVHPTLFTDELDRLVRPEAEEVILDDSERSRQLKELLENMNPKDFGKFSF